MSDHPSKFYVFADDHQIYGPSDRETLEDWARQGLISTETWIFHENSNTWASAGKMEVLCGLLATPTPLPQSNLSSQGLKGGHLRRIRLFADMTSEQAETFAGFFERISVRAFSIIVRQGEHGDAMFLIMDGEVRVEVNKDGKDDLISTLQSGDFFGEVALLDEGPRSATVVANKDCHLLKLSKKNFENMMNSNSDLTSRFLLSMNRLISARIRMTNERFSRAQNFARGTTGKISIPPDMRLR